MQEEEEDVAVRRGRREEINLPFSPSLMPVSHYWESPEDPLRTTLELEYKLGRSSGDPQGIRYGVTLALFILNKKPPPPHTVV